MPSPAQGGRGRVWSVTTGTNLKRPFRLDLEGGRPGSSKLRLHEKGGDAILDENPERL